MTFDWDKALQSLLRLSGGTIILVNVAAGLANWAPQVLDALQLGEVVRVLSPGVIQLVYLASTILVLGKVLDWLFARIGRFFERFVASSARRGVATEKVRSLSPIDKKRLKDQIEREHHAFAVAAPQLSDYAAMVASGVVHFNEEAASPGWVSLTIDPDVLALIRAKPDLLN